MTMPAMLPPGSFVEDNALLPNWVLFPLEVPEGVIVGRITDGSGVEEELEVSEGVCEAPEADAIEEDVDSELCSAELDVLIADEDVDVEDEEDDSVSITVRVIGAVKTKPLSVAVS